MPMIVPVGILAVDLPIELGPMAGWLCSGVQSRRVGWETRSLRVASSAVSASGVNRSVPGSDGLGPGYITPELKTDEDKPLLRLMAHRCPT
jgi:hypothetical protein